MLPPSNAEIDLTQLVRFPGLLYGLVVLAITWFLVRTLTATLTQLGRRFADKRLVLHQVSTVGRFVVFLLGFSGAALLSLNLSRDAMLALTGTAAVTIGLSLKDLVTSVIAGIIIIIDRPFQVGDRINFGGTYGEVQAIGLRSVRLATLDDNVVTIPNSRFLTDVVASGNWGALDMMIQLDFFVGVDQDVALAKRLVEEALTTTRYVFTGKPWLVQVDQVVEQSYYAVRLRAQAYVLDVQHEKSFHTDVTMRVLTAFREHGVKPPAVLHRNVVEGPAGAERVDARA
jgi:small-conductance mechanosensitive channel